MVVHIQAVTPKDVPFTRDTDQVFAVHSVAKLFGAAEEDIIGRKYRFEISWNGALNKKRFSDLTAILHEDEQRKSR